jgi:hypothetical protein
MARIGVVARRAHDDASSAPGWNWPSKLAQAMLGQRRVDWTWSSWEVVSRGQVDQVANQERLDAREDRPSVGSWR